MLRIARFFIGPGTLIIYVAAIVFLAVATALLGKPSNSICQAVENAVPPSQAIVIALDIGTGGSPGDYVRELSGNQVLWTVSWIIRAVGWLLVPAVIGVLVGRLVVRLDSAYAKAKRSDVLDELARDQGLTGRDREKFKQRGLELLADHEQLTSRREG